MSVISSFLICIPFISLSCLISLVRLSSKCKIRVVGRDILAYFLILMGKHLVLSKNVFYVHKQHFDFPLRAHMSFISRHFNVFVAIDFSMFILCQHFSCTLLLGFIISHVFFGYKIILSAIMTFFVYSILILFASSFFSLPYCTRYSL